ncbi:uncharacterized protein LOC122376774 [Amphibalanus amphitrite]|uniref:uncharacterized protein LOC122376774 n=1 Tax=Amphibalanus amphitrite TaxID=1232801 RepID=UPI001C9203F8|nr:uncharacterized protein LOC122376774 [Amphibalanus amphitrite]
MVQAQESDTESELTATDDVQDDDWDDPDYIPDHDSDEDACPPSVASEGLDELPRYPGLAAGAGAAPAAGGARIVSHDGDAPQIGSESAGPQSSPYPVAMTANSPGRRKWNRRNFCPYCERPHAKLTRHLQRAHATEFDVAMALMKPVRSLQRRRALCALAKLGNYRHNIAVRSGEKRGELVACNRARTLKSGDDYLACNVCKGFFLRATLWRHKRVCNPTGGGRVQAAARAAMPSNSATSSKLRKVLDCMCIDSVSLLCKTDDTILLFGEYLCAKLGTENKDVQNIRNRIRELGRLLEVLRTKDPEAKLKDFIEPRRFSELTTAVREMCGFSSESHKYATPSLALKIGQSMKVCAEQILAQQIESGNETSPTRQFIELYNLQWTKQVSRHALVTLQEAKWNKVETMPVAADIQLVHRYLDNETELKVAELTNDPTPATHKAVAELVLARLIMFNRRRQGEASAMTIDAYQKATSSDGTNHPEVTSSLSSFEQHLAGSLLRVVIRGKKGRGVPMLLTQEMRRTVDILLEHREAAGVGASQYVFVNSMASDDRPLRGADCLRKFARLSGLKNPESLTSTKLRKHIATLSQVLNLKDNELDLLAGFLGHDVRVHRSVYRMPEATTQLALVSKLLMASEQGMGAWRGKSLGEIQFEDIPDVEEIPDADEDAQAEETAPRASCSQAGNVTEAQDSIGGDAEEAEEVSEPRMNAPQAEAARPMKRKKWTPEEDRAIHKHFAHFISRFQVPGKVDCVRAIAAESALSARSWTDVKNCVYNRIQKRKKHGH